MGEAERRGSVLVEFALVALVLYLILAATMDLSRSVLAGQVIQSAADTLARELAEAPLPPTATFEQALECDYVKTRIFDESALVIDLDAHPPGEALDAYFETLPVVNQVLRPVMIVERVGEATLLRYPGALFSDGQGGYAVRIPQILARDEGGVETELAWHRVVEEMPSASGGSLFGVDAPGDQPPMVAVRILYPYQAAAMSAFDPNGSGKPLEDFIEADDSQASGPAEPGLAAVGGDDPGPYAGPLGLGWHYAFGVDPDTGEPRKVRPFRKLLRAQAVRWRTIYDLTDSSCLP